MDPIELLHKHGDKLIAFLVYKYAKGHAVLTEKDIQEMPQGWTLVTRGHPNAIQLYFVSPERAEELKEEVRKKGGLTLHE